MLEGCDGNCNGSDTSLILAALAGVRGIMSIYCGGVVSHTFGNIALLTQTGMVLILCVFWKGLKYYKMI